MTIYSKISILILSLCSIISCNNKQAFEKTIEIKDSFFTGIVKLEKIKKLGKYRLSILNKKTGEKDNIYTPYEIFEMETGDVNRDGKTDICIGIIKPTPFDSVLKKRLFIFQIDSDFIRPLWLSSRLVNPLESFIVCKNKNEQCVIHSIEKQGPDIFCIREYKWESFGMTYIKTIKDSLLLDDANNLIKKLK